MGAPSKVHLLHVTPPLPEEEAALLRKITGKADPTRLSRCGTGVDRAVPLAEFSATAPRFRCGRCDTIAMSPGVKIESGPVTTVTRSFLGDSAPMGAPDSLDLDRVKIALDGGSLRHAVAAAHTVLAECRSLRSEVKRLRAEVEHHKGRAAAMESRGDTHQADAKRLRAERDEVRKAWRAWEAARDDGRFSSRFPETIEEAEADVAAAKAALDRLLGGAE